MPKITFDSDEEFEFDEDTTQQQPIDETSQIGDEGESDSDDDAAPEAVSISSSRNKVALEAKAQKEAALNLMKTEKEKRRQRDLQLKQQKQGSRREKKQDEKKKQPPTKKQQDTKSGSDEEEEEEEEEVDISEDGRLPQHLLEALNSTDESINNAQKRTHLTMADFEAMQADQEAELERQLNEQRKKQKKADQGRKVGEYTVKVLNKRPQVTKAGKNLQHFIQGKMNRKSVVRQNAVISGSASRLDGGALVFRRQPVSNKKKN